jgi:D-alanine-D-alanine ligase
VLAVGLSPAVTDRVLSVARQCFTALGVTDYGRIDLRLAKDGTPYVLEVNPNCDLSDGAGLSRAARAAGIPYDQVIETIGVSAKERFASEQLPLKQRVRPVRSAI